MKRINLFFILIFLFNVTLYAQDEEILLTIDDTEITKNEFERIYNKNKTNISTGEVTSVDEYLELFINFKLKVLEAEKAGLNQNPEFKTELEGYRKQLIKPYLTDEDKNEELRKEAYQRMRKEVRASHILIEFPKNPTPDDTLKAYNKAIEIRRRIVQNKEDFSTVAKGASDDPSVKNNAGDLGYFSVFQMVYPFESAVYNLNIGQISHPIRTQFGYHIIQKTAEREAIGEVKVAHIMVLVPRTMSAQEAEEKKTKINEIYHKIKAGEDFAKIAREYSEDKGSARYGGELPWFGTGRMIKAFETASFSLREDGEISKPIQSSYGWHIIKRLGRKKIGTFQEMLPEINKKMTQGGRTQISRNALVEKLKKEYKLIKHPEKIFSVAESDEMNKKDTLFTFADIAYTKADYIDFLAKIKALDFSDSLRLSVLFEDFIASELIQYEENHLEEKYDDLRYLIKEYHDGMLLFELTDQKVWTKAAQDSIGLREFYEKNKSNYMWGERFKGTIYYCQTAELCVNVSKAMSKARAKRKYNEEEFLAKYNVDTLIAVKPTHGIYSKGDNQIIDEYAWGGKKEIKQGQKYFVLGEMIPPNNKKFEETKGIVISDYQNQLEKAWIEKLRNQYEIKINKETLSTIK